MLFDGDLQEGSYMPKYYDKKSEKACPVCQGEMTIGEEECGGICSDGYWKAVDKMTESEYD